MANLTQRYAGGVAKQLADGVTGATGGIAYNQYAPGGPHRQLSGAAGATGIAYDQYAPGGPVNQFLTASGVVPPAGPTGASS
jgi:hypothetical protein